MNTKAFAFTAFGACLLASYVVFGEAWAELDKTVFYFFNDRLIPGTVFLDIVAYTNKRVFDVISFTSMGLLYFYYFRQKDNSGKRTLICLGLCMLLTGILIKRFDSLIPIHHASPTYAFEGANRLTQLTDIVTKDASRDSFPGDHGMMLMIFAAFIARYFGRRAFAAAVVLVVVFSLPRIMSGAHWFTDIYVGSLSIVCMTLSWLLLTPASDICAAKLERLLPRCFFPPDGPGIFR